MKDDFQNGELYESRFAFKARKAVFTTLVVLLVLILLIGTPLVVLFTTHTGVIVKGNSMKNTLQDGDKLFVKQVDISEVDYGDIIVVDISSYLQTDEEKEQVKDGWIIKRLIAKEGDRVFCQAGVVKVWYAGDSGWTTLEEDYAYYGIEDYYKEFYEFEEYQVGAGEIFFLGDNRSSLKSSIDSRYKEDCSHNKTGLYKQENIVGVVTDWSLNNRWLANILINENN